MITSRKILSLHIEKTAGTSLQAFWEESFGRSNVLIYNLEHQKLIRSSDFMINRTSPRYENIKNILNQNRAVRYIYRKIIKKINSYSFKSFGIPLDSDIEDYSVIHGHFDIGQFREKFPNHYTVAIVRDPLKRMISQYLHWQNSFGVSYWHKNIPYHPNITFEEYSLMPELQNFQSSVINSINLTNFDIIGVVDYLDILFAEIAKDFNIHKPVHPKVLNKYHGSQSITISKSFASKFRKFHSQDYLLYELVKKNKVLRAPLACNLQSYRL